MMNSMHPLNQQGSGLLSSSSLSSPQHDSGSSPPPSNFLTDHQHCQDFPHYSFSKLLLDGLATEEERFAPNNLFQNKELENWKEGQFFNTSLRAPIILDVKQEVTQSNQLCGHPREKFQACKPSLKRNFLDFSIISRTDWRNKHLDYHSSDQCNSTVTGGGVAKKARVQSASTQPPLKKRKEKLGGRIAALHQLVSPFGKSDTASVLLEVIRCIGFLEAQIEELSSPYLRNVSASSTRYQLTEIQDGAKDLRTRGLCLVPVACSTHYVNNGNDNGPDYNWSPTLGGGFR